ATGPTIETLREAGVAGFTGFTSSAASSPAPPAVPPAAPASPAAAGAAVGFLDLATDMTLLLPLVIMMELTPNSQAATCSLVSPSRFRSMGAEDEAVKQRSEEAE